MLTDQMQPRVLLRNELRRMLAEYRKANHHEGYPSLITKRRVMEGPTARFMIHCGMDKEESFAIASELIISIEYNQFAKNYGASYTAIFRMGRTALEITVP